MQEMDLILQTVETFLETHPVIEEDESIQLSFGEVKSVGTRQKQMKVVIDGAIFTVLVTAD